MPVKVLGANGSGTVSAIADGIRWAADHGAHVINMSFGTTASPIFLTALQDAVQYASGRGVLLVAASGNSGGATPMYPAAYPEVIAVGATLYNRQLASYSNRGNELCAPGGTSTNEDLNGDGYPDMILQNTFNPNTHAACDFGYWFFAGTSMATPHVAGLAALVKSEKPELTAAEIRQVLRDTADGSVTPDCGYGLVDATRALESVAAGDRPPTVSIFKPGPGQHGVRHRDRADRRVRRGRLRPGPGRRVVARRDRPGRRRPTTAAPATTRRRGTRRSAAEDSQVTLRARATDNASPDDRRRRRSRSRSTTAISHRPAAFSYSVQLATSATSTPPAPPIPTGPPRRTPGPSATASRASGKTVRHTFAAAGTYTVGLTVTDELGATGTASENVTVQVVNDTLHVSDLDRASRRLFLGFWEARITIRVADATGSPVPSARVSGLFSDGPSLFQCTTNTTGACTVVGLPVEPVLPDLRRDQHRPRDAQVRPRAERGPRRRQQRDPDHRLQAVAGSCYSLQSPSRYALVSAPRDGPASSLRQQPPRGWPQWHQHHSAGATA